MPLRWPGQARSRPRKSSQERSDAAISSARRDGDFFAPLAMTLGGGECPRVSPDRPEHSPGNLNSGSMIKQNDRSLASVGDNQAANFVIGGQKARHAAAHISRPIADRDTQLPRALARTIPHLARGWLPRPSRIDDPFLDRIRADCLGHVPISLNEMKGSSGHKRQQRRPSGQQPKRNPGRSDVCTHRFPRFLPALPDGAVCCRDRECRCSIGNALKCFR